MDLSTATTLAFTHVRRSLRCIDCWPAPNHEFCQRSVRLAVSCAPCVAAAQRQACLQLNKSNRPADVCTVSAQSSLSFKGIALIALRLHTSPSTIRHGGRLPYAQYRTTNRTYLASTQILPCSAVVGQGFYESGMGFCWCRRAHQTSCISGWVAQTAIAFEAAEFRETAVRTCNGTELWRGPWNSAFSKN